MKFKKAMLITFILLAILTMGAAGASENIASDDLAVIDYGDVEDASLDDELGEAYEENVAICVDDGDELGDVNPDYRYIQDEIDKAEDGDTINLVGNYTCDYLITVDKSVTIEGTGDGAVIRYNGSNNYQTPFFHVAASNVVLKNIKFVGGTFLWSGAIYWGGDNGTLSNCEFTDNIARGNNAIGGALLIAGNNCNVSDCIFNNNHADLDGGAILCSGNGTLISNCIFSDNYAIGEKNDTDNSAHGYGGAVVLYGFDNIVENCNFTKNYCTNYGGAISSLVGNNTIINCRFYSNYVLNSADNNQGGGAIFSACQALLIDNCTFIENEARKSKGGAVSLSPNDTVKNSYFKANYALEEGNDIIYGFNITSNIFALDYGERELDAIVAFISIDDLKSNNIFNRTKINSTVTFSAGMIFEYASEGSIHVTVEGGTLEVENITVLNHPEAKISFSNNVLRVSNLAVGKYVLKVITTPDENHTSVEGNLSITVKKAAAVIKAQKITVALKKSTKWSITIVDSRTGKGIAKMKITLNVYTGSKYKTVSVTTNSKGVASYQTKGLTKGTHKIVASATHAGYTFKTLTSSIKVIKQTALTIKVKKKTRVDGASLSITVTNKKTKKPVNGVKLTLLIYTGKTYKKITLKTMKKGKYSGVCGYATNKFSVGTHKVKITPTDIKYSGSATSSMKITKKAKKVPSWETKDTK